MADMAVSPIQGVLDGNGFGAKLSKSQTEGFFKLVLFVVDAAGEKLVEWPFTVSIGDQVQLSRLPIKIPYTLSGPYVPPEERSDAALTVVWDGTKPATE